MGFQNIFDTIRDRSSGGTSTTAVADPATASWDDFMNAIQSGADKYQNKSGFGTNIGKAGGQLWEQLRGAGGMGANMGFATLMQILQGQGRTSPDLLNRQLTGISRDTEATRSGLTGEAARRNLGSSGLIQALDTAVAESGADRRSGAIADENRLAEERKRSDLLNLFKSLIIDPSTDASAMGLGLYQSRQGSDTLDALLGAGGAAAGGWLSSRGD